MGVMINDHYRILFINIEWDLSLKTIPLTMYSCDLELAEFYGFLFDASWGHLAQCESHWPWWFSHHHWYYLLQIYQCTINIYIWRTCSIYNTSSGCFSSISSYFMFTSSMRSKLAAVPSTWGWHEVRIGQVPLLRIILHSWQEVWEGQNLHQHRMKEQNCGQWMHERLPQTADIWQKTAIIGWGNSENTPFLENNGNHVGAIWNFCALLASVCVLLQLNEWDVRWRQCIMAPWPPGIRVCVGASRTNQPTHRWLCPWRTHITAGTAVQKYQRLQWPRNGNLLGDDID